MSFEKFSKLEMVEIIQESITKKDEALPKINAKQSKNEFLKSDNTGEEADLSIKKNETPAEKILVEHSNNGVGPSQIIDENNNFVEAKQLPKISEKRADKPMLIKIDDISSSDAIIIISKLNDRQFNLSFKDLNHGQLESLFKKNVSDKQVDFIFDKLNKEDAGCFVDVLRKENYEFCLEFDKLNANQAKIIIINANLDQEKLEISKIKYLKEMFMKDSLPFNELEEFAAKGIEHLIEINEKRFIPWRSIAIVSSLGLVQICAGGILMATGFGLSTGMGLIAEGISDLVYAYTAYSTRQFNWHSYCTQKAVSIAISLACAGFGKLNDAGKAVSTLTSEVSKEALEQAGAQFVSSGRTIAQHMVKSSGNLKSLTFKYVGTKVGEAVAREALNTGVKYLSNFSFELIKPQISESVQLTVKLKFNETALNVLLRKMYAIDENMLKANIDKIVADALNPERNALRKHWDSIGMPLMKGILSNPQYLGSTFSMALRIAGTLQGLYAIQAIIDNVYEETVSKLTSLDRNTFTMTLLLNRYLKIEKEQAREISKVLIVSKIVDSNNLTIVYEDGKKIPQFELKNKQENENVASYLKNLYARIADINLDTFDFITKSVADKITEQVIRIIESQLVAPWSTLAVSCGVNALSVRLQHYALVDSEQNTDSQNADQKKYDLLKQKQDNNEALTDNEKNFMNSHGSFNTFDRQLQSNAKDYCVSYEQCEIAYNSQKVNEFKPGEKPSQKQIDIANQIREKKPASIAELSTIALKNGIKLKTVDDKNYQRTPEEIEEGVEVIFIEKGEKDTNNVDGVAHAYFMDANGNFVDVKTEPNDCAYGAISAILEINGVHKSTSDLRNETADTVLSNKNFASVINAETWIQERYPQEANTFLFSAGLKFNPIEIIECEEKDIPELEKSINQVKNKNGGRGGKAAEFFKVKKNYLYFK